MIHLALFCLLAAPPTDPKEPKPGEERVFDVGNGTRRLIDVRVLRGGSRDCDPKDCRSAKRIFDSPGDRYSFGVGFRVVVSQD